MPPMPNPTPRWTAAVILAASVIFSACAGCKSRRAFNIPEPETAEQRAAALARAESLAREAQHLELAGKEDKAVEKYVAAIGEYRDLPVAWANLGVLLDKQGKNLDAAEAYKTASELAPTDPRPLYNLGTLWEKLGYLDDAARWYDESLHRDPNYLPALRRSVLVDDLRNKLSQTTSERLKKAILLEREPWWINRFKRIQQRMDERPLSPSVPRGEAAVPVAPQ